MITKTFILTNPHGLHARAADKFVRLASRFSSAITVIYQKKQINAKSIMSVLTLDAGHQSEIQIVAEGDDEKEALLALETLIQERFGET